MLCAVTILTMFEMLLPVYLVTIINSNFLGADTYINADYHKNIYMHSMCMPMYIYMYIICICIFICIFNIYMLVGCVVLVINKSTTKQNNI